MRIVCRWENEFYGSCQKKNYCLSSDLKKWIGCHYQDAANEVLGLPGAWRLGNDRKCQDRSSYLWIVASFLWGKIRYSPPPKTNLKIVSTQYSWMRRWKRFLADLHLADAFLGLRQALMLCFRRRSSCRAYLRGAFQSSVWHPACVVLPSWKFTLFILHHAKELPFLCKDFYQMQKPSERKRVRRNSFAKSGRYYWFSNCGRGHASHAGIWSHHVMERRTTHRQ